MNPTTEHAIDEPSLAHQLQEARAASAALATIDTSKVNTDTDSATHPSAHDEPASKPALVAAVEDAPAPAAVAADSTTVEATEHAEPAAPTQQQQQQQHSTGLMAGVKRQLANFKKDSATAEKTSTAAAAEGPAAEATPVKPAAAAAAAAEDKKEGGLAVNLRRKLAAGLEHLQARDVNKSSNTTTAVADTTESQAIAAATPLPPSMPETPPTATARKEEVPPVSVDTAAHVEEKSNTPRELLAKFRRRISGGLSSGATSPTAASEVATPALAETAKSEPITSEQPTLAAASSTEGVAQPDAATAASAPAVIEQSTESKSAPLTPATGPVDEAVTSASTPATPGGGAAEKRRSMRASLAQSWRKFSDKDVRSATATTGNATSPDATSPIRKDDEKGFSLPFKRRRSASPPAASKEAKTSPAHETEEAAQQQQTEAAPAAAAEEAAPATTTEQTSGSGSGGALLNLIAGLKSKVTPLLSKDKTSSDATPTAQGTTAAEAAPAQPRRSFSVSDVKDRLFGVVQKQRPKSVHGQVASEVTPAPPLPAPETEPVERVKDIKESLVNKAMDDRDHANALRNRTESVAETVKQHAEAAEKELPAVAKETEQKEEKTTTMASASSPSIDTQVAVTANEGPSTAPSLA